MATITVPASKVREQSGLTIVWINRLSKEERIKNWNVLIDRHNSNWFNKLIRSKLTLEDLQSSFDEWDGYIFFVDPLIYKHIYFMNHESFICRKLYKMSGNTTEDITLTAEEVNAINWSLTREDFN